MSTICLAAQRSYATGEAVYFAYRLPDIRKVFSVSMLWLMGICALLVAGLYAHIYWNCRHPQPEAKLAKVQNTDTRLSDMHYVYVSKPFPEPKPKAEPLPKALPMTQEMPPADSESEWQQAPDGDNLSRQSLPGAESPSEDASLKERFMQALQEQREDYQQGKTPAPPEDETQALSGSEEGNGTQPLSAETLKKANVSPTRMLAGNSG